MFAKSHKAEADKGEGGFDTVIVSVTTMVNNARVCEVNELAGIKNMERLNHILQLVAAAYSDDPGTSDLDDEQPVSAVTGLNLGDVRLARRLTR